MSTLIVMDHTGDTRTNVDTSNELSVAAAQKLFDEFLEKGYTPVKRAEKGKQGEISRTYDPTAEETLFIPRLQGG